MTINTEESIIVQKTRELCQTILDQPEYRSIRRQVDEFLADESAKNQYQLVVEKGESLQHKQQMGVPLSEDEIQEFEKQRDVLINNPVARGFLDAQQQLQAVQNSVSRYVTKTIELGRVPTAEDLSEGSCGSGCGCGHGH